MLKICSYKKLNFSPLCRCDCISALRGMVISFHVLWDKFSLYFLDILLFYARDHPGDTDDNTRDHNPISLHTADHNHLSLMMTFKKIFYDFLAI